jgi:hypothetical protein
MYNTSDVVSYCGDLASDPSARPRQYWRNSSGNDVIRDVVESSGARHCLPMLQELASGGSVCVAFKDELAYEDFSNPARFGASWPTPGT